MTVGQLPARSSRVMVTIDRRTTAWYWRVPGGVGESPLLRWVWRPPLPAHTPGPPLARPLQAGGGGGGDGGLGPGGGVGVVVVVGVGTSGRAA